MRSIVYNDISKSNFEYLMCGLKFYFSSEFNKKRFVNGCENYINEETNKLQNKYRVDLTIDSELAVAFYKKVEKRGYKVINYLTDEPFDI